MGHKATEERLREVGAGSYCTRESDIKKGIFVLTFLSKTGAVKHSVLRNPERSLKLSKTFYHLNDKECEALRVRVAELEEQVRILSLGQASSS